MFNRHLMPKAVARYYGAAQGRHEDTRDHTCIQRSGLARLSVRGARQSERKPTNACIAPAISGGLVDTNAAAQSVAR